MCHVPAKHTISHRGVFQNCKFQSVAGRHVHRFQPFGGIYHHYVRITLRYCIGDITLYSHLN